MRKFETLLLLSPELSADNREGIITALTAIIEREKGVMFVYRDDVYKFQKPADRPPQGIAEIIIGKQRNGPVGVAELMYMSPYTSFEDIAPDWMPPPSEGGS